MAAIIHGLPGFLFDVPSLEIRALPIKNLPENAIKVRVRFRSGEAASVFVRTTEGLRGFRVCRNGDHLSLEAEFAANVRTPAVL